MIIKVKSCRSCLFLVSERQKGEIFYSCNRGVFGYSNQRPEVDVIHPECEINKEDIILTKEN